MFVVATVQVHQHAVLMCCMMHSRTAREAVSRLLLQLTENWRDKHTTYQLSHVHPESFCSNFDQIFVESDTNHTLCILCLHHAVVSDVI